MAISVEEMYGQVGAEEPPAAKPSTTPGAISVADMYSQVPAEKPKGEGLGSYLMASVEEFAKGSAELVVTAAKASAVVPMALDWIESKRTGKQTTEAQDTYFRGAVDPWVARVEALTPKGKETPVKGFVRSIGGILEMLNEAILTGGESALEPWAVKGVAALTPALEKSTAWIAREVARRGIGAMQIPAVKSAVTTAGEV